MPTESEDTRRVSHSDLYQIQKDVREIGDKLSLVHLALMGSSLTKDGGIIQRLIECERGLDEVEKMITSREQKRVKQAVMTNWIWAGVSFLLASLFYAILSRLQYTGH